MLKTPIGRLRLTGLLEGASLLVLLYCSIVLKWIHGDEEAVRLPGAIHGGLFILLCLLLCLARKPAGWTNRTCAVILGAAILPFGPFVIEPWLRREDQRVRNQRQANAAGISDDAPGPLDP
tara:strand:- start:32 stop:394 length:363 start_codon:yes stop_codon:yes gene_type:complete